MSRYYWSPSGALKEAAGDAAYVIDPFNEEGLANSMTSLLESETLRQELKEKDDFKRTH